MTVVVTFGSPKSLNSRRPASRMRSRVRRLGLASISMSFKPNQIVEYQDTTAIEYRKCGGNAEGMRARRALAGSSRKVLVEKFVYFPLDTGFECRQEKAEVNGQRYVQGIKFQMP